jgi:hypothetical protein
LPLAGSRLFLAPSHYWLRRAGLTTAAAGCCSSTRRSILHHLVFLPNPYESMQFLIDRDIDMTIKDYRWDSNAAGWARYGKSDEKMALWLEEAERQRETTR